nr:hypothetical protein [Tanacetum cinerariifolium]
MGDKKPIRTLGDYSKPSHEGYMNTIELPVGNNVVPILSETIRGPHDTQYCMEDLEPAFVEYESLRTDETGVLFARSYLTKHPQCSTHVHGSINSITIYTKQPNEPQNDESEEKERGKEGNLKDTNTMAHNEEQRDTPYLELKDTIVINNLGPNRNGDGIEWLDVEEPLDLVDTSKESVYESLIKEMPKCSLNYDFRIKRVTQETLKFHA